MGKNELVQVRCEDALLSPNPEDYAWCTQKQDYNPCSDKEYKKETHKGIKAIYEANDNKAYHDLHWNRFRTRQSSENE